MSTINSVLKSLACAVAAVAITAVTSWSFVESTSAAPYASQAFSPPAEMAKLTIQQRHVWFGQAQPAVLVD